MTYTPQNITELNSTDLAEYTPALLTELDSDFDPDEVVDPYPGFQIVTLRRNVDQSTWIDQVLKRNVDETSWVDQVLLRVVDGDDTPPTVANPQITLTEESDRTVTITYNKAVDDKTATNQLVYEAYVANGEAELEILKFLAAFDGSDTDVAILSIGPFGNGEIIYVTIGVVDRAGNRAFYENRSYLMTNPEPQQLVIDQGNIQINVEDELTLTATEDIQDYEGTKTFVWSSSDTGVATINSATGFIEAIAEGQSIIRVEFAEPELAGIFAEIICTIVGFETLYTSDEWEFET